MATTKIYNFRLCFLLCLSVQRIASTAAGIYPGQPMSRNQSTEQALDLEHLSTVNNVTVRENDLELHSSPNDAGNSTRKQTHGARMRRSVSSSGACAILKDELYEFYSALHEILSMKTRVSKISSFDDVDCSVGFQNIITTATNLRTQVNNVAREQEARDEEYNSLRAKYDAAAKIIQDQIDSLENQKNENSPELQGILTQINALTAEKNLALEHHTSLTDFQETRLMWLKTLWRCTTSKRTRRQLDEIFSVPTICPIQPQRIKEIQTLLQATTKSILATFLPDAPTAQVQQSLSSQSSCAHGTQSLRSELAELKDAFRFSVTGRSDLNSARITTLTRLHEAEIGRLNRQKDDLTRSINQTHAEAKGTKQNILQTRQQQVNDIRTRSQNLRTSEKSATIQFAAQLVHCGENTWAVLVLQRLTSTLRASNAPLSAADSEQLIRDVVTSAYNKNLANLEKLLNFANQLPKITEVITATEAIYEEMRKLAQLGSPQILLLAHQVDGVINSGESGKGARGPKEQNRLRNLESKLKEAVDRVFSSWASNINSGSSSHILQFPKLSVKTANAFNHYLPRLIQKTYDTGRLKSVERLLGFANNLSWYSHKGTVLSQLFKDMRRHRDIAGHPEISLVAFRVKVELNRPNNHHVIRESKHLFEGVKKGLPSSVRNLVWGSRVKMWSRQWAGYTLYGGKAGNICTYPNDNYAGGKNQRWTVHVQDNGRSFKFQNQENGRFLFAAADGRAFSGASTSNDYQRWMIYPESNEGEWVYIRNRATRGLLDANKRESCASSRECCCSTAHAHLSSYNSRSFHYNYQQWKISG